MALIKKIKRLLVKGLKSFIRSIPQRYKGPLLRSMVNVPTKAPSNLVVKFVEDESEYLHAFKLLKECYVEAGICEDKYKIKVSKFHTLPTSKIIIVKIENEVVATMTHIMDGPMGLPCEQYWSIDHLRNEGALVAELSSLAVKKSFRKDYGLFMFLTRFALEYAMNHLMVDYWVMVTHPNAKEFYSEILCFEPISSESFQCEYVMGAQGFAQKLNLNTLEKRFRELYAGKALSKNIFEFYFKRKFSHIFYFEKETDSISIPMSKGLFLNLFEKLTPTIMSLTPGDKKILQGLYSFNEGQSNFSQESHRSFHRTPTCLPGVMASDLPEMPVKVLNISKGGVKVLSSFKFDVNSIFTLRVKDGEGGTLQVPVQVCWTHNKFSGLKVIGPTSLEWRAWATKLARKFEDGFYKKAG